MKCSQPCCSSLLQATLSMATGFPVLGEYQRYGQSSERSSIDANKTIHSTLSPWGVDLIRTTSHILHEYYLSFMCVSSSAYHISVTFPVLASKAQLLSVEASRGV